MIKFQRKKEWIGEHKFCCTSFAWWYQEWHNRIGSLQKYFFDFYSINLLYSWMNWLLAAKIRRLYDIANVLTSIGLIKKYHFNDASISRPAYKYIGPQVDVIRNAECIW